MIVKKLGMVSGGGFPGAGYNERKVAEGVARLIVMENVDGAMRHKVELLHETGFDCAGEIEKYLKERSRTYGNPKTTRFQFHIAASVKWLVMSADELTDFARQLMAEAGYGRQPYFVYYHHIPTTITCISYPRAYSPTASRYLTITTTHASMLPPTVFFHRTSTVTFIGCSLMAISLRGSSPI